MLVHYIGSKVLLSSFWPSWCGLGIPGWTRCICCQDQQKLLGNTWLGFTQDHWFCCKVRWKIWITLPGWWTLAGILVRQTTHLSLNIGYIDWSVSGPPILCSGISSWVRECTWLLICLALIPESPSWRLPSSGCSKSWLQNSGKLTVLDLHLWFINWKICYEGVFGGLGMGGISFRKSELGLYDI